MSESNSPKANDKPAAPAQKADQPMREVLTKLLESASHLSETDKQLGLKIRDLGIAAKDPLQFNDTSAQHQIATVVRDFERVTGRPLDLSTAQRAEVTRLTAPAGAPDTGSGPQSNATTQAHPSAGSQSPPDPIRDVLSKLVASINQLPESAKTLALKIRELETDAGDPVRFNQKIVQHNVAYAAQDFEKATGRQLDLAPAQRAELSKLAAGAPGLDNERMSALLGKTAQIDDHRLVKELRSNGAEIGKQGNQSTPGTQSRIEVLENKVRNAPRAAEPGHEARAGEGAVSDDARNQQRPKVDSDDSRDPRNGTGAQKPSTVQSSVLRGGILDTLTAALRGNGRLDNAPWDPQASPFGDRVTAFQAKVNAREQDRTIGRVENSARAAVDALDGFRNTEGATVMNRIQTAARAEPGGMQTVLSEMREGGRFSDLRQAFNTALNDDKGFAQAYDKAATALARYGEGREKVEQIIAKRPDAANLTAKFEQLDSQIGERASNTPSRNEGKNMLEDISKTIAEIIQKATDAVRSVFSRTAAATAGPSVSPAA